MEVKLFENDTSEHLEEDINAFLEQERPLAIDKIEYQVTPSQFCNSGLTFSALILYENKATTQLRRKSFELGSVDEVNSFIQNHDVIKVENFGTNSEEITTALTYRETKK